ncbi:hypothetical protein MTO96_036424 [Rhipicephalus appendiculatus]
MNYFFEKWRLLHAADSALSDASLVCLITLGLPKCIQRHVQLGRPQTPEELLQIMKLLVQQPQSAATAVNTAETLSKPDSSAEYHPRQKKKHKRIKGMSDDILSQIQETTFLTDRSKLVYVPTQVNGKNVKALVDSGASITVINKNVIPELNVRKDSPVIVYVYDGRKQVHDEWADILIACQGKSTIVKALVLHGVKYELLMSRPVMQELRLNLYWDGQVTTQDDRQLATFTAVGDHPHGSGSLNGSGHPGAGNISAVVTSLAEDCRWLNEQQPHNLQ